MPRFQGEKRWLCKKCGKIFVTVYRNKLIISPCCNSKLIMLSEITPEQQKKWWDEEYA